jgi:hypothetical protein
MVSVDLILMKIEDPIFLSKQGSGDANCCSPSRIVLYFSSCHRLEAFNSFKLVFIIIMHSSFSIPVCTCLEWEIEVWDRPLACTT